MRISHLYALGKYTEPLKVTPCKTCGVVGSGPPSHVIDVRTNKRAVSAFPRPTFQDSARERGCVQLKHRQGVTAEASPGGVKLGSVSDGRLAPKIKITTARASSNWEGEAIVFEPIVDGCENIN